MLEEIGEIVVFGLENRLDRWLRCVEILQRNGITKVTHYTTIKDENDVYKHAVNDFLQMLRVKRGTNLVFFEDDFELTDGWRDVLSKAWTDLPKDYDMLYLGCNLTAHPAKVTENLYRINGAWCMHGVVISSKFIDYILRAYEYPRLSIIDDWCRTLANEKKFYMTYPMISYQRKSYSDFVEKEMFYDIFENKYYKRIQEL